MQTNHELHKTHPEGFRILIFFYIIHISLPKFLQDCDNYFFKLIPSNIQAIFLYIFSSGTPTWVVAAIIAYNKEKSISTKMHTLLQLKKDFRPEKNLLLGLFLERVAVCEKSQF